MPDSLVGSRGFQFAVNVNWKWEAFSKNNMILPSVWAVADKGVVFFFIQGDLDSTRFDNISFLK